MITPELKPLKTKETVVFNSSIEGNSTLVRTGECISMLSAILLCVSDEYLNMYEPEKNTFIEELKKNLIEDRILDLNLQKIDTKPFEKCVYIIIYNFYKYVSTTKQTPECPFDEYVSKEFAQVNKKIIKEMIRCEKDEVNYDILSQLLPLNSLYTIFNNFFNLNKEPSQLNTCKKQLIGTLKNYLDNLQILKKLPDEKSSFLIKLAITLIRKVVDEAQFIVYKNDIKQIKEIDTTIDENMLVVLEDYFQTDILMLDSRDRMPIHKEYKTGNENTHSIVILKFENENKYEPVYRLIKRDNFQRRFPNTCSIVKSFYDASKA